MFVCLFWFVFVVVVYVIEIFLTVTLKKSKSSINRQKGHGCCTGVFSFGFTFFSLLSFLMGKGGRDWIGEMDIF